MYDLNERHLPNLDCAATRTEYHVNTRTCGDAGLSPLCAHVNTFVLLLRGLRANC